MKNKTSPIYLFSPVGRFMLILAAFVVIVAGMKAASALLVPFLLAIFISVLCSPALTWLQSKRVPSFIAIILIVAIVISVGGVLGLIFTSAFASFANDVPLYTRQLNLLANEVLYWLQAQGAEIEQAQWDEWFQVQSVFPYVRGMLSSLGTIAANAFIIIITVIFILAEEASMNQKIKMAFRDSGSNTLDILTIGQSINRYMALKTLISFATGALAYALCLWVGVEYAILWGTLAFLLNFIPTIGSIVAAIPPVLLALVQISPSAAAITAVGYLAINTIIGNLMEPRIMGRSLGLSPLIVLMSLIFWGWVLGSIGMLLSVPLTMIVKIALEGYPDTRWISAILGNLSSLPEQGVGPFAKLVEAKNQAADTSAGTDENGSANASDEEKP